MASWTSPFVYLCQFHLDELCSNLLRTQTHSQKNSRYTDPTVKSGLFFPLTVFSHSCYFSSGTKIKTPSSILVTIRGSQCGRELRQHCDNVKRFSSLSLGFSFEVSPNTIKNTKDFVLNGNTEKNQVQVFFVTGTETAIELERWQSSEFPQSYSCRCTAWPLNPDTFFSISFLMCIPLIQYVIVKGLLDLRAESLLLSLWELHRIYLCNYLLQTCSICWLIYAQCYCSITVKQSTYLMTLAEM